MSGIGQLFIFGTITVFDPLVLSLITTTRKVFTILFSAIVFGHMITTLQWFGVFVLFAGLLWGDLWDLWRLSQKQSAKDDLEVV